MNEVTQKTDLAIQALESAWESGVVGDFETVIPPEAQSDSELLTELACVDLELRIQRDAETRIESYTTKFPQLEADEVALLELIRTEYSFRADRDQVDSSTYRERFPHLQKQIELMFQLELNRSSEIHTRGTDSHWQCRSCGELLPKKTGRTACFSCGTQVSIGRYELLERVGQGAFGFVYRAHDPKLDRDVAVKVPRSNRFLTPEESERFLRESRNAAQLDHAGIVRVFDTGRHEGIPYIVSEFAEGQPLSIVLAEQDFDFHETAEIVATIAKAVGHAHDRGVIHRDLKPSNIMANPAGDSFSPRVMDFGLARSEQKDISITLEGQAVGTPAYMSPEQASGELESVDPRSDVYSLGVILYQMICGELPFRGNVQRLIQQVVEDDPPPPSRFRNRIPRDLETICMKAINRDHAGRYVDAHKLAGDLSNWLEGKPIQARRIGTTGVVFRWCRRRPTVAALLGVLAFSVIAGVSGITWQWRAAETARMASEADLNVALESVDKVLGHLGSDTLRDIPQAKELRAEVLNDALVFFQRFQSRSPDDPRVEMQVAKANIQVARIQHALGKAEPARKAFQAAIAGYERVENRAPSKEDWQLASAHAYSSYANFLFRQSKRKEGEAQQRKCVAISKLLLEAKPKSAKRRSKYATARADLGRYVSSLQDAQKLYDKAIKDLGTVIKQSKTKIGPQRDLARVLNNYAARLKNSGRMGKAESCRQQAIKLLEIVIAADPKNESKRSLYASCCLQLVESLREESRVEEAGAVQTKAVDTYKSLAEDFPATPRHRERYGKVLNEVGSLALAQKRNDDACDAYEEAVRQSETLLALFPGNVRYKRQLVDYLWSLADTQLKIDQKLNAEKRMRQGIGLQRELLTDGPAAAPVLLAVSLRDLALLISKSKSKTKREEAKRIREEADRLVAEAGVEKVLDSELSNSKKLGFLNSIITLAKSENDLDRIARCYQAKIDLYQEGVLEDPKLLKRRSGMAKQWGFLSDTLRTMGQEKEAAEALRNAIKIDELVLKDDPESATYATMIINHSSSLGQILQSLGKYGEGADVVQRSLDLASKLHGDRKDEGFLKLREALAYMQIGNARAAESKDFKSAMAAYEQAVARAGVAQRLPGMAKFEGIIINTAAWFMACCPDKSLRKPQKALELAKRAVKTDPENGNHVGTLAFTLHETAQYGQAIEQFQKANKLNKRVHPLNTLMIALAQAKSGKLADAKKTYADAVKLNDQAPTEPELFEIYRQEADKLISK